jgi:hypothetical protein
MHIEQKHETQRLQELLRVLEQDRLARWGTPGNNQQESAPLPEKECCDQTIS